MQHFGFGGDLVSKMSEGKRSQTVFFQSDLSFHHFTMFHLLWFSTFPLSACARWFLLFSVHCVRLKLAAAVKLRKGRPATACRSYANVPKTS